jgi:hypothetical protein
MVHEGRNTEHNTYDGIILLFREDPLRGSECYITGGSAEAKNLGVISNRTVDVVTSRLEEKCEAR